jgi:uncharacterized membrane protein
MATSARWTLLGLGIGAGLAYLLEPGAGRRRYHRARGVMAEVTRLLSRLPLPDDVLEGRVRARLAALSSHPHALRVRADRGQVLVNGPILTREAHRLVRAVSEIPGVEAVVNELDIHDTAAGFPADRRSGRDRRAWPNGARLAAAMAGGALAAYSTQRRGVVRAALAGTGAALLAGSLRTRRARSVRIVDHVVSVHKTIDVAAPLHHVFDVWSRIESLPLFLSGLQDAYALGNGTSRWVVDGPDGTPILWDTQWTAVIPEQLLSWRTTAGAPVSHEGTVRFRSTRRGGTQVEIQLTYDPPAGALGHVVARLFGADPESRMDEDLARLKASIESLRPARVSLPLDPPAPEI